MKKNIPELVLPGGDLRRAKIAFDFGADAVYVGLNKHSLRKGEVRFDINEIGTAIQYAHSKKKKLYVTFNVFAHEGMLEQIKTDLEKISAQGPDAFIISDPGVINLTRSICPKVPIHLSTQANTLNSEALKFWRDNGVKRVVLGREATLSDIKKIKEHVPEVEIEVFVHGAMCISYSGRCLASSILTRRSANLGACAQPCRWDYKVYLEEEKRPGERFELEEDGKGSYLMNSRDLCLIEHLDNLLEAGVDSFKIEGRNKTDFYVANTAKIYREALSDIEAGNYNKKKKKELLSELKNISHREYTTGFIFDDAKKGETYDKRASIPGKKYVGYIISTKGNHATVLIKHKIKSGETYELITPKLMFQIQVTEIKTESETLPEINPGRKDQKAEITFSEKVPSSSFLREL